MPPCLFQRSQNCGSQRISGVDVADFENSKVTRDKWPKKGWLWMKYYENIEKKPTVFASLWGQLTGNRKDSKSKTFLALTCHVNLGFSPKQQFSSLLFGSRPSGQIYRLASGMLFGPSCQTSGPKKSFPTAVERHSNLIQISWIKHCVDGISVEPFFYVFCKHTKVSLDTKWHKLPL